MLTENVVKKVNNIGEVDELNTVNKSSIISAINEINEKTNNISSDANSTSFDNSLNGMIATNVQTAIEENKTNISLNASKISNIESQFDNRLSNIENQIGVQITRAKTILSSLSSKVE